MTTDTQAEGETENRRYFRVTVREIACTSDWNVVYIERYYNNMTITVARNRP
jgi:hypothetical protein